MPTMMKRLDDLEKALGDRAKPIEPIQIYVRPPYGFPETKVVKAVLSNDKSKFITRKDGESRKEFVSRAGKELVKPFLALQKGKNTKPVPIVTYENEGQGVLPDTIRVTRGSSANHHKNNQKAC